MTRSFFPRAHAQAHPSFRRFGAGALTLAASVLLVAAPAASAGTFAASAPAAALTDSPAATLRTNLNLLAQAHVYLAGAAIDAALGGRTDEFTIAAAATDQNSQELAAAVGSIYGSDAQQTFLNLWRAHIGFFVDYTQAAAARDTAKQAKARADLDGYRQDIDAFFSGANPNLPKGAVAQLFVAHVQHLTGAIDMLAAGDLSGGYAMLRMAAQQTPELMDPLSAAIVKQFPDRFPGSVDSPATGLRVALNNLAQEHVYLAGFAFNAALAGRADEFNVAAAATDQNTQDLAAAVGSVYGADAQQTFLRLWRAHIGFFVDYAQGAATNDSAKMAKARADLDGYRQDIDAFFSGANPNLPKGAVAQLFVAHVQHLTGTIDMLAAGNVSGAYAMLRMAAQQTPELANALAEGIVAQFPDKFTAIAGNATMPAAITPDNVAPNLDLGMTARDGKSLSLESTATRTMFVTVWGSTAPAEWVTEHNLELTQLGR